MANLAFYLEDGSTFNHPIEGEITTIGRHPDSVVVLEFPSVSGRHASIEQREDGHYIIDHKSSNGTRVNGAEIEEAKLKDGDRVGFGDVQSVYYEGEAPLHAEMPAPDIVVEVAPPPPPSTYRPTPLRRTPGRRGGPSRVSPNDPASGGGCFTALLVIAIFITAFLGGLYMRHSKETNGGNIFSDIYKKLDSGVSKIQKAVEEVKP